MSTIGKADHIRRFVVTHCGNKSEIARKAGINRKTIRDFAVVGNGVNIDAVEAILNAMGFTLEVKRLEQIPRKENCGRRNNIR